jgi:hypothetical protein
MFVEALLRRLGSQSRAIDNARTASTELSQRRVEREAVEIFLDRLHARSEAASGARGTAVPDP